MTEEAIQVNNCNLSSVQGQMGKLPNSFHYESKSDL